jgi:hypothetical protein
MFIAHVFVLDRSSFRSEMTKRYAAPKGAHLKTKKDSKL